MDISELSLAKQSLAMAKLAKAAYLPECANDFAHHGFDQDYKALNNRQTHGHIACNADSICIAFKGTKAKMMRDYVIDADVWPNIEGNSWVHRGFKRRADLVISTIIDYVERHPGKSIWITGHSLGGALALYTTCELESLGYGPIKLFTFGSPRTGNRDYCDLITSTHCRFVNCNDVIPKIPLSLIGYRHHGKLYYIDFYGQLQDLTTWQRAKDQFRARVHAWRKGRIFNIFYDHSMSEYIRKLSVLEDFN